MISLLIFVSAVAVVAILSAAQLFWKLERAEEAIISRENNNVKATALIQILREKFVEMHSRNLLEDYEMDGTLSVLDQLDDAIV